ncbi:MAG TPA: DUF962 domain-containing protein [Bacteroidia bacterium]|jgi:hypothetical protein
MKTFIIELRDFYPIYLRAHSDRNNQVLHFIGASLFFSIAIAAFVLHHWWLMPVAIFTGYFLPGIGHKHYQKNSSFRGSKPVLCVVCAFKLYIDTLTFRIGKKMSTAQSKRS